MLDPSMRSNLELRQSRRLILVLLHDYFCAVFSIWSAATIVMPLHQFFADVNAVVPVAVSVGFLSIALSAYFGVFSTRWRIASLTDFVALIKSAIALSLTLLMGREVFHIFWPELLFVAELRIAVLGCIFTLGLQAFGRIAYRYYHFLRKHHELQQRQDATIFVGDLQEAESAIKATEQGLLSANIVACLLPEMLIGAKQVRRRPVFGSAKSLEAACSKLAPGGIIVTSVLLSPSFLAKGDEARDLKRTARRMGLSLLKMEAVALGGRSEIRFEDFLFRKKRQIDHSAIDDVVRGKRILVTGGGGSIGGDIALRAAEYGASEILLIDISEFGLQTRLSELKREYPQCKCHGLICDIVDKNRLKKTVIDYAPQIFVHAAALKHVDLVEHNWQAAVRTNVLGTAYALAVADESRVPVFINISTDKAVEPVSILGLTKRMGERLVASARSDEMMLRFSVRFGNVLGSSGSVIQTFLEQISAGGPITLTDERVQRYFMSRTEAAELVLASSSIAKKNARIFLLDMGEPVFIKDLAIQLIEWSGRILDKDVKIITTGLRPGERLTEKLVATYETIQPTSLLGISSVATAQRAPCDLDRLRQALEHDDYNTARNLLKEGDVADGQASLSELQLV